MHYFLLLLRFWPRRQFSSALTADTSLILYTCNAKPPAYMSIWGSEIYTCIYVYTPNAKPPAASILLAFTCYEYLYQALRFCGFCCSGSVTLIKKSES